MTLSQVVIVLCNPDESRNIGSVCRAMLTMNIRRLRIVGNRSQYDENHILTLALHAKEVWNSVEFFETLEQATGDCVIIAGTTRRRGKKRKNALLLPEEFATHVSHIPDTKDQNEAQLALVFGNERTGLTDIELDVCTMGVTIPTGNEFGSLNLSHAVQIFTYELFRASRKKADSIESISPGYIPISVNRLNNTLETIVNSLQKIGFFKLSGKKEMTMFWQSILTRALLSQGEATYLEKIFTKAAALSLRNKNNIPFSDD